MTILTLQMYGLSFVQLSFADVCLHDYSFLKYFRGSLINELKKEVSPERFPRTILAFGQSYVRFLSFFTVSLRPPPVRMCLWHYCCPVSTPDMSISWTTYRGCAGEVVEEPAQMR